ncbi:MAG: peptidylprolyl isomerase [Anaerolineae bacterium]|nr:peptidylprolyl isomerase [Anaerolineae bacterium]
MARRIVQPPKPETKKARAIRKREERQILYIYIGLGAVAFVVLLLLALGLYQEYYVKPASPVAIVGSTPIRTDAYQKRVQLERYNLKRNIEALESQKFSLNPQKEEDKFYIELINSQLQLLQSRLENVGLFVLEEMIDEELIRQKAAEEGVTVSPEELQLYIERLFGYERYPPTPTPTPAQPITITETPTPQPTPISEEDFRRLYQSFLSILSKEAGITEQEYRDMVAVNLLREKLRQVLAEKVPSTAEQVRARHILLESEEEARKVLEELKQGADFAELARKYSKDEATRENGGDLGWFPKGEWDPAFDAVAFSLKVGEISDVVRTSMGYHIIKVEGHEMDRELDPEYLARRKAAALDEWLQQVRYSDKVQRLWKPEMVPPEKTP